MPGRCRLLFPRQCGVTQRKFDHECGERWAMSYDNSVLARITWSRSCRADRAPVLRSASLCLERPDGLTFADQWTVYFAFGFQAVGATRSHEIKRRCSEIKRRCSRSLPMHISMHGVKQLRRELSIAPRVVMESLPILTKTFEERIS
jgi:hypothetical protein